MDISPLLRLCLHPNRETHCRILTKVRTGERVLDLLQSLGQVVQLITKDPRQLTFPQYK